MIEWFEGFGAYRFPLCGKVVDGVGDGEPFDFGEKIPIDGCAHLGVADRFVQKLGAERLVGKVAMLGFGLVLIQAVDDKDRRIEQPFHLSILLAAQNILLALQ